MDNTKKQQRAGRAYIIATAMLWGLAGVCVKSIPWSPFSIMSVRCAIGIILIGITNRSFSLRCNKKTLLGSVAMSMTGLLYMISIKLTTAATAIVLQYVAPILVFLYTVVFQKVKPKLIEAFIVLAVFGGCVLSFADELDPTHILGNALGLLSGVTFAAQIIIFSDKSTDSSKGMYVSNFISCFTCLPFIFIDKNFRFSPQIIFWVLILGIFQYGLANIFYAKGCQKINKVETSLLLTIEPIFNPIPVWIVRGERPGFLATVGFFIVIAAVTLYAALPFIENKKDKRVSI